MELFNTAGKAALPYIPACKLNSLSELARLALFWKNMGFLHEAGQLASWLKPLGRYPSLWTTEKEFDEEGCALSMEHLSSIEGISGASFDFSYTLLYSSSFDGVFTWAGRGTSLGAIRAKGVEIRSFGPQSPSLTFGVRGNGIDKWVPTSAYPEVWMESSPSLRGADLEMDFRFVGITPETPLVFAFYLKGAECQIGGEFLRPKTLRRFKGEGREAKVGPLTISSRQNHKIEVIPLAGAGGFWNADFLISFEIHPLAPELHFTLES